MSHPATFGSSIRREEGAITCTSVVAPTACGQSVFAAALTRDGPRRGHDGADQPEEREEDAENEQQPMALTNRQNPEGDEQHEINDPATDEVRHPASSLFPSG